MNNMFKLIGKNEIDAKKDADKVMEIETRLAKASSTRVERRDPVKNYNKMSFDSLQINYSRILIGIFISRILV